jgi:hypothetical protein
VTAAQQVLFSFDDHFPKDQRQAEAENVLAACRRGKSERAVVPAGMHVHVRERSDLPWHPIEPLRGRGQPPKVPAGTWEDDDQLAADVQDIIGRRDERAELDAEAYDDLKRLADRVLGRQLTSDEETILRRLCYGTGDAQLAKPRGARGRRPVHNDEPLRPEKANVIARHLLAWRHNVTDPDVRRMQRSRREGRAGVKMIFR